ncbi:YigZ family protein [Kangiella koreensis]|uniref:Impact N-terminal domain-containing protein n=1 Tax=Kangiella koreensis (strain DSM 16069 / JCM 12317 / KCTC 12182 / SW-125) TaxID=523791 RepID=C7R603_KANKD|nr:YigZ family protein [Kangiella koreensis]ACV25434.1 protein of unknown function UPF0029 [Kangiella koreensis DSM 16069]
MSDAVKEPLAGYRVPQHSVEHPFSFEEVIKGSRFIARVAFTPTVEDAKAFINHFNQTEPEATHHCWAYIVGNPASTTLIACSDDGEPSGTAGMPMLNVLQHSDVGDITAVVTRYYGGTKLGTGGLARAYGGSVKQAMDQIKLGSRIYTEKLDLTCAYELQKQVEYLLKEAQAEIVHTDFAAQVTICAQVPVNTLPELEAALEAYINRNQIEVTKVTC